MTTSVESSRAREPFIPDPGLALYLPLYEMDGTSFMSKDAYGHLCTATGALWRPSGRYFDGVDDSIIVPHSATLAITNVLTVIAWVRTTDAGHQVIIGKNYKEYEVGIAQSVSRIQIYYGDGTNFTNAELDSTPNVWDGNFHHIGVIIRKDGSGCTSVVDGNFIETVAGAAKTGGGTADVYVGVRNDQTLDWDGTIGEIQIYNRALTPQEIQHNYLATKWRYR